MWFIYFFFLFVSNDDDEKRPCNMPCLPSVIVTRKDHCWVLLQSLIDTVYLHTKLWFGFRTLVVEVTTADEKRKNDLQPCSRKLQRVPLPVPLLDQKITRVKIDFFIFFGQHSEEAPAENSSCRISSNWKRSKCSWGPCDAHKRARAPGGSLESLGSVCECKHMAPAEFL